MIAYMPDNTIMFVRCCENDANVDIYMESKIHENNIMNETTEDQQDTMIEYNKNNSRSLMTFIVIDAILTITHAIFIQHVFILYLINSLIGFVGAYYLNRILLMLFTNLLFFDILTSINVFCIQCEYMLIPVFQFTFDTILFLHLFHFVRNINN